MLRELQRGCKCDEVEDQPALTIREEDFSVLVLESSVITVGDGPRLGRGSRYCVLAPRPIPLISVLFTRILTQCQRLSSQAGGPVC